MTQQVSCKDGQLHVTGEMTIYHAAALYRELLADLNKHGDVRSLDLSRVTEIDTAGIQVLLVVRRHAVSMDRPLEIVAVSPAVSDALELLHLGTLAARSSSTAAELQ